MVSWYSHTGAWFETRLANKVINSHKVGHKYGTVTAYKTTFVMKFKALRVNWIQFHFESQLKVLIGRMVGNQKIANRNSFNKHKIKYQCLPTVIAKSQSITLLRGLGWSLTLPIGQSSKIVLTYRNLSSQTTHAVFGRCRQKTTPNYRNPRES